MNRIMLGILLMAIFASTSYQEEVQNVIFEDAIDGLPAELTAFKDLFGPSFIRAIKTVLSDCAARMKQLDESYEPTMEEMKKKYEDAMNIYEQEVNINPELATQLQETEMRQLKNFVEGADRAKEEERQKIEKQCQLRKQDLLRNRMYAVLSVFKDIYEADPDNLILVTDQLQGFIKRLEQGLEQCRKMVNSLIIEDPTALCDDDAISEAIEFIKMVLLTLPSQVQTGFPDLPGDTEGEVPLDDGSTPDIFVGEFPNILMPGPVIIDEPPEDDDDIDGASGAGPVGTSGAGPIETIDGSGDDTPTTPVTLATTEAPVTTDDTMTTNSPATTEWNTVATTTDSMVTTDSTTTSTTGVVDDTSDDTVATEAGDIATDDDNTGVTEDIIEVEVATTQPVGVEDVFTTDDDNTKVTDVFTAEQRATELDVQNDKSTKDDEDHNDDDNKGLLPLYIALLVCIGLLVAVMVIMIVVVLILRHKAIQGRNESTMSEDDKLSLMKEGYVNPTYQFFDKSSSTH